MTFKRRSGGAWTDVATTIKRRTSGAWQDIDLVRRRAAGAWTVVWRRVDLSNANVFSITFVGTATAQYQVRSDGSVHGTTGNNTVNSLGTWLTTGTPGNYEVRVTVNSGSLSSGSTGSWLALSSNRVWTLAQSIVGSSTANLTIEIRNASTLVVIDSATVDITAERG